MPINEGVIIANAESQECIDFFAHYMGTYEAIKDDKKLRLINLFADSANRPAKKTL